MTRTSDYTECNSKAKKRINEPDCSKKLENHSQSIYTQQNEYKNLQKRNIHAGKILNSENKPPLYSNIKNIQILGANLDIFKMSGIEWKGMAWSGKECSRMEQSISSIVWLFDDRIEHQK